MKTIGLLLAVLVGLSGQAPAPPVRHLVYQFGYNTKAASSGQGTGTLTVDISAPVADGGVMVSGSDFWWNTVRPRATNTCEVYPNGNVRCAQAPYALSAVQLTLFPLLARNAFKGLSASGKSSWERSYQVKAAIVPGASGFAGQSGTWMCNYALQGKGPIANAGPLILITATGTLDQQTGRNLKATSKQSIVYDPVAKVPSIVRDVRTHIPMKSVYSNDMIELKLLKDSKAKAS
ncbi:MAG TPA: hypothetical protein VKR56_15140 [Candidatus Cybelea sp.]|nr:hypothetical protein [Candidatus Cybelea sp.]